MPIITTLVIGARPCSTHGAVTPSASSARLACQSWPTISAVGQVAVEALLAGRAERAVERAAGLRRDAQRAAVVLGDVDGLDRVAAADVEQPLARAVGRRRVADHASAPRIVGDRGEPLAQRLREVGHRAEVVDEPLVHPARHLPRAKRLLAEVGEERGEAGGVEVEQVDHGRVRVLRTSMARVSGCRRRAPGRSRRSRPAPCPAPSEPCTALASIDCGEIGADRAGRGLLRVGGAHQVAVLRDGVLAFEHLDHHRAGDHELDQVLEERPLAVHGVEALGLGARQPGASARRRS